MCALTRVGECVLVVRLLARVAPRRGELLDSASQGGGGGGGVWPRVRYSSLVREARGRTGGLQKEGSFTVPQFLIFSSSFSLRSVHRRTSWSGLGPRDLWRWLTRDTCTSEWGACSCVLGKAVTTKTDYRGHQSCHSCSKGDLSKSGQAPEDLHSPLWAVI